jgi:hypothetical protein
MNTELLNYDWKKEAATQAMPNDAAEQAFMSTSLGFVANRAGVLMQDPHRLGFEVVWGNEDSTKMVGIYAFRIRDELLYCPVFFINGSVKGYDLLQRTKSKTFVPFTEEWVSFLVEKQMPRMGKGIEHRDSRTTPNSIELTRLAFPPISRNSKWASTEESYEVKRAYREETKDEWTAFFDVLGKPVELDNIMPTFLTEDGGQDALTKMSSLIEKSPAFAQMLAFETDTESWASLDIPDFQAKEAAAAATPTLTLFRGGFSAEFAKSASAEDKEDFFKKGYALVDNRKEDDLSVIYEHETREMEAIGRPGIYDVLGDFGDFEEAFVAKAVTVDGLFRKAPRGKTDGSFYRSVGGYGEVCCSYGSEEGMPSPTVVVLKDGRSTVTSEPVYGRYKTTSPITPNYEDSYKDYWKTDMATGKAYFILDLDAGAILPRAVYVVAKDSGEDGIKGYTVVQCDYGHENTITLRFNPDTKVNDLERGVFGANVRFLEVDVDKKDEGKEDYSRDQLAVRTKEFIVASPSDLDSFLLNSDFGPDLQLTTVSIAKRASDGFYYVTGRNGTSDGLGPITLVASLARDLRLPAKTASYILDQLATRERVKFFIEAKSASVIRTAEDPQFEDDYDDDFGVALRHPEQFALATEADYQRPPAPRVGDAWDPSMGQEGNQNRDEGLPEEMLLSYPPEQLASVAQQGNFPHMFDHATIGSLVDTYDSMAMIDKYIPAWEKALDCLGRALFLFYWKPQDFEKSFGVDDMTNTENKLLSNFKSFGDMVLDFYKRNNKAKGSVNAV